jgi:cytochrome c6
MRWRTARIFALLAMVTGSLTACSKEEPQKAVSPGGTAISTPESGRDGEALFKQYCAPCHPNGGNVNDPDRTLYGSALKSNHITTPEDIVRIMRRPLSRMIRFDAATISDRDARVIAEFVLKNFK